MILNSTSSKKLPSLIKTLWGATFLCCLVLFSILLPRGSGIALALIVGNISWISYLLIHLAYISMSATPSHETTVHTHKESELRQDYHFIKKALIDLELDYLMKKISLEDYEQIRRQYRKRAVVILEALDKGDALFKQIQTDISARKAASVSTNYHLAEKKNDAH